MTFHDHHQETTTTSLRSHHHDDDDNDNGDCDHSMMDADSVINISPNTPVMFPSKLLHKTPHPTTTTSSNNHHDNRFEEPSQSRPPPSQQLLADHNRTMTTNNNFPTVGQTVTCNTFMSNLVANDHLDDEVIMITDDRNNVVVTDCDKNGSTSYHDDDHNRMIYHYHHNLDDLNEQQLDELYYNDANMLLASSHTASGDQDHEEESYLDDDKPLMMDDDNDHHHHHDSSSCHDPPLSATGRGNKDDDDVIKNHQHNDDPTRAFACVTTATNKTDTMTTTMMATTIHTKGNNPNDDDFMTTNVCKQQQRPRSVSFTNESSSPTLLFVVKGEADHHPTPPPPSLPLLRSSSLPKLHTPIEQLIHEPFLHKRQPSVIHEGKLEDDDDDDGDDDNNRNHNHNGYNSRMDNILERMTSINSSISSTSSSQPTEAEAIATTTPTGLRKRNNRLVSSTHDNGYDSDIIPPNNSNNNNTNMIPPAVIDTSPDKISTTTTSIMDSTTTSTTTTSVIHVLTMDPPSPPIATNRHDNHNDMFVPYYTSTYYLKFISSLLLRQHYSDTAAVTWISFWAMLLVTCANHILTPMRDAIALQLGVSQIPKLTLASTALALFSSVPIGWLFEAPDPNRRRLWKQLGLTRGDTQGTSLALFYRIFAIVLISYAIGFSTIDYIIKHYSSITTKHHSDIELEQNHRIALQGDGNHHKNNNPFFSSLFFQITDILAIWSIISQCLYIAFFLVVHLMKLHCLSLIWGVATEAIEYEEDSMKTKYKSNHPIKTNNLDAHQSSTNNDSTNNKNETKHNRNQKLRLEKLSFISFGGTMGGIIGSILASFLANKLQLPGLLLLSAYLLEISAELSIEIGNIMQKHWMVQQQLFLQKQQEEQEMQQQQQQEQQQQQKKSPQQQQHELQQQSGGGGNINGSSLSNHHHDGKTTMQNDMTPALDSSMKRSVSLGSMKRVASGNSLHRVNSNTSLRGVKSISDLNSSSSNGSLPSTKSTESENLTGMLSPEINGSNQTETESRNTANDNNDAQEVQNNEDTFRQRLLRGIYTIIRSRLLMAIFTYNALYASTNVLLSFQRAVLVANRSKNTSVQADTAFLANINTASSIAIFTLQATGIGANVAHICGPRGTLSLMPIVRLLGVMSLAYWHHTSKGQPPNLLIFLILDEFCKIMNLAIAKPVRESLWRGLSNEARYEAKPIVDTIANRWGGGSSAFLVAFIERTVRLMNHNSHQTNSTSADHFRQRNLSTSQSSSDDIEIFGFPPILFLCMIIATWWAIVSADLGHIRKNIDNELKKRQ